MAVESPAATIPLQDREALKAALQSPHPVIIHLNGDTTWLLQLPYPTSGGGDDPDAAASPPPGRARFNVLLDPWLTGPQSDVASWFSTQWHVVAPGVQTLAELNGMLAELEGAVLGTDAAGTGEEHGSGGNKNYIDVVAISHEFTDHCHEATLRQLPAAVPVFAADKAADLVRSWRHFDTVVTLPGFSAAAVPSPATAPSSSSWRDTLGVAPLPLWVGIGRVVTQGNALYYHSAVVVSFLRGWCDRSEGTTDPGPEAQAIVYSPHGIKASDISGLSTYHPVRVPSASASNSTSPPPATTASGSQKQERPPTPSTSANSSPSPTLGPSHTETEAHTTTIPTMPINPLAHDVKCPVPTHDRPQGLQTLALLHGLHDVRLGLGSSSLTTARQLNLGGRSGAEAARAAGCRYWVATHDEVKRGGGLIAPLIGGRYMGVGDGRGVARRRRRSRRMAARRRGRKGERMEEGGMSL